MLLGARVLERISQSEIECKVLANFPIVLHEGRRTVPAVVVIEQERSNGYRVRYAQQKAGEVVSAICQVCPTVVACIHGAEFPPAAGSRKEGSDAQPRMAEVHAH